MVAVHVKIPEQPSIKQGDLVYWGGGTIPYVVIAVGKQSGNTTIMSLQTLREHNVNSDSPDLRKATSGTTITLVQE